VLILVFSPAGSTRKIAQGLEARLSAKGHVVQFLDISANLEIFKKGKIAEVLQAKVKKHDLLCIGSPVYEKHIEMYMKKVYEALPKPDEVWGSLAVPFFTYGGISSGVALRQARKILLRRGRRVLAAMKIESSHIVTKKLKTRVNENLPGPEAEAVLDELVNRIESINTDAKSVSRRTLNYQGLKERFVAALMKERVLHLKLYGRLRVDPQLCIYCQKCLASCPIQRIEAVNQKAYMTQTIPECIHCFSCVNVCAQAAISYENGDAGWAEIERIFSKVAKEGSLFRSEEADRSVVYPVKKG
jgi:ferredoxin/NAD(P)H-dependent FMN reductase